MYGRWTNASTGDDEIITVAHTLDGLNDFAFIIRNHFNSLQLDAQRKTVFGEESGVGVDCLYMTGHVSLGSGQERVRLREGFKARTQTEQPSPVRLSTALPFHQGPRHQ